MDATHKTTPEQRDEIARRYAGGESGWALGREFGDEVMRLLHTGLNVDQIARELGATWRTVRRSVGRLNGGSVGACWRQT